MTKIELNQKTQTPFLLSKKEAEGQNSNYFIVPFSKDAGENDFSATSPLFSFENLQKLKPSEPLVASISEVSKKTGLSQNYINRLINTEGLRLNEYNDERGIRTIGVGHNINSDPNYKYGKTITKEIALTLLTKDLNNSEKALNVMLDGQKLKPNQKEALVDMIFNMGAKKFEQTKLLQLIKQKRFKEAPKEFDAIKAGKKVSIGLCLRRIENISRFSGEEPSIEAVKTMNKIYGQGVIACDKKIRKSRHFFDKIKNKINKVFFIREAKGYINNCTALYKETTKHKK